MSPSAAERLRTLIATGQQQFRMGQFAAAAATLEAALRIDSNNASLLALHGISLAQSGDSQRAQESLRHATSLEPRNGSHWTNLGNVLQALQRHAEAIDAYDRAIALQPALVTAHVNRGNALLALERWHEAEQAFDRALTLQPNVAASHKGKGLALLGAKEPERALEALGAAAALAPNDASIALNVGVAYDRLRRHEPAREAFLRALSLSPDYVEALLNLGFVTIKLGDPSAAIPLLQRAIAKRAEVSDAWANLGVAYDMLQQRAQAIEAYQRAIALDSGHVDAHLNLASALNATRRYEEALAEFTMASKMRPESVSCRSLLELARLAMCDWSGIPTLRETLVEPALRLDSDRDLPATFTFLMLPIDVSMAELKTITVKACRMIAEGVTPLPSRGALQPKRRLRIGYVSSDIHDHATAHLMQGLFERHDREVVEVYAYSFGVDDGSAYRKRIAAGCDVFRDIRELGTEASARAIHADDIDILVDLKGYTLGSRSRLFAYRPAPVQVQYLGYPGTMGVDFIDYALVDRTVAPPEWQVHFTERLVHLPHCYQVNDCEQPIADASTTRDECGLPERGFVFCCFNANLKIEPMIFDAWMRILKRVPSSVLWLLASHENAVTNLRAHAEARGVSGSRLVFAPRASKPVHLARHRHADLFLDTHFCNAHTTASDALWAGVPLLTCPGQTFQSRVAASLLKAIGLDQLIMPSLDAYEAAAVRLANDRDALHELRSALAANKTMQPLFDTQRFARDIERAFFEMWERSTQASS